MADKFPTRIRSRIMASIKGKNTKPELAVRKMLFGLGFRYRLHVKNLPGSPDLVLKKYRAVIFIHGCFWHGHKCAVGNTPRSNVEFWERKIKRNSRRDRLTRQRLLRQKWRVLVIRECALTGKGKMPRNSLADTLYQWIKGKKKMGTIRGHFFSRPKVY